MYNERVGSGKVAGNRCTYTEVGDDGIDAGDFEPTRCVRRCCDVRLESLFGLVKRVFEVTWRSSALGAAVGGANYRNNLVVNVEMA